MKTATGFFAVLFVLFFAVSAQAAEPAKVEVLFMNHGPLRSTINNIRTVLAKYESKISAAWYDFDSREGEEFMKAKGIDEHVPLIIWINGSFRQTVDGTNVSFKGFPSGSGPDIFQGAWNMDMLDKALDQATR